MHMYQIGDLRIAWKPTNAQIPDDDFSEKFRTTEDASQDIILEERSLDPRWLEDAACLKRSGGYELLRTEKGLLLMNHWAKTRLGYGILMDELYRGETLPVYFGSDFSEQPTLHMTRFLSSAGLHSKLLQHRAPVVHAAYVVYENRAILFTAPAQTGKSTQARLWAEHVGVRIVNGDRVLLRKREGIWTAFGYPCCGSSDICENVTVPVAAIVVLEQAAENRVERMSAAAKIRALVSAMEIYLWEQRELDMAFRLAEEIVCQVPVVKLCCRPDAEAVAVLKQYLEENGYV